MSNLVDLVLFLVWDAHIQRLIPAKWLGHVDPAEEKVLSDLFDKSALMSFQHNDPLHY